MSRVVAPSGSVAAHWREIRRLYPIYAAIARAFEWGDPPFKDLNDIREHSDPETIHRTEQWLTEMEERIHPHHLRQLLESGDLATSEDKLHTLIDRHLGKREKTDADRDKLDFLLIQYFATCAPPSFHDREVELADVADVLETVLRQGPLSVPKWLEPVEALIELMHQCRSLEDLEKHRLIERGRELKAAAAERYFDPIALVTFTRFNYLLRRTFFRLLNQELRAIENGLRELEARGVKFVDCTSADLSPQEPMANLHEIHRNWKRPLIPDYSTGHSFDLLLKLRAAVEQALAPPKPEIGDMGRRLDGIFSELDELHGLLKRVLELLEARKAQISDVPVPPAVPPPSPAMQPVQGASPAPAAIPAVAQPSPSPPAPVEPAKPAPVPTIAVGIERIKKLLSGKSYRANAPVSIAVGTNQLMLIAGEVSTFLKDPDEAGVSIQRAVAARFLLIAASEWSKQSGQTPNLKPLLESAQEEAASLDRFITQGEKAKNVALVETLVHTRRQLLAITQQLDRRVR